MAKSKYAKIAAEPVAQSAPLDARQVPNNAGGFVYQIDDWARLDRFLILGSDAATYYASARALTKDNAAAVTRCYGLDPDRTVGRIVEISDTGRAPKNDPAIFALALGAVHPVPAVRTRALGALPAVCRTASHLFQFVDVARALGKGWGRAMKRAVANWYAQKEVEALAYQAIKYRQREGYTHKRLLQTAHPKGGPKKGGRLAERDVLYRWMLGKRDKLTPTQITKLPALITAHETAMGLAPGVEMVKLVETHRLPWEALPTEAIKDPRIWQAMLPTMGLTALIRNLGAMTSRGVFTPLSAEVQTVVTRLGDLGQLRKARIHPFHILQALVVYRQGRGVKGDLSWMPDGRILQALDEAFYLAFQAVAPTHKRILIGLDVSGSMGGAMIGGVLSAREAAAAMAMVTMRTESNWHIGGFTASATPTSRWGGGMTSNGFTPLPALTPNLRLDEVTRYTANLPFGSTDCALPMLYALKNGIQADVFMILTDNETWAGGVHPMQALRDYRKATGIPAKLVTVGMTATEFSIGDAADGGCLDVVGFDAAAPAVIADFVRG